ncbi:hypothetical protein PRZ48_012030 [Zasmidium cellare]|uniref:Stealth protein CR3 conserved region 3 domain-containing protein n=1 Tax=Zasmidium cellare TaxID=395010 RepID=A0ABR0E8C6_ZASCE|nr:hypothetical protein PRZ48_012030 [Zasmidium cellare]
MGSPLMPSQRSYMSLLFDSKWLPKSLPSIAKALVSVVVCAVCLIQIHRYSAPARHLETPQSIENAYSIPSNDTHHIFQSTPPSVASRRAMRIRAYDAMSDACAEQWVVHGQWGSECIGTDLGDGLKVDGVWAWVNGSDPVQVASRQQYRPDSPMKMDAAHRYADHNELLFSMRSAAASLGSNVMSRMHILASAYWLHNQSYGDMAGQVPAWLDKEEAMMEGSDTTLQHDADFFRPIEDPQSEWTTAEAQQCWNPAGEEPGIMRAAWVLGQRFSMRSHYYITHHPRALWLPLLREAAQTFPSAFSDTARSRFRAQRDVPPSVQTVFLASWYVVERHREALLWSWIVARWGGRDGLVTPQTKQRMWEELADGKSSTRSYISVGVPVRTPVENIRTMEKAEIDVPSSTEYSFSSKDGYALAYVDSMWWWNRPRHGYPDLTRGLIDTGTGSDDESRYSKDPDFVPDKACIIRWPECFGSDNETADEVFKRIAFQNQRCGDCIITGLIGASGISGIGKFVPEHDGESDSETVLDTSSEPPHLPLTSDWRATNFSMSEVVPGSYLEAGMSLKIWTIRLIQRYSYVMGSAASEMYKVETARGLESKLDQVEARIGNDMKMTKQYLDELSLKQQRHVDSQSDVHRRWRNQLGEGRGPLAFLCLNDDVKEKGGLRYVVDQLLLNFFQRTWTNRLNSERNP